MLCSWKMRQCFSTWTWNFFAAGLVLDWGFLGGRSGLGGFLGFFCWFVFGFVLGFIFSEEAQISFDGSSVLCFVWHFLRAVLFRYKSSVYSLSIHTCKFY